MVVNEEALVVISLFTEPVITKGNIADCKVEKAVGEVCFLKACHGDVGTWVELFCNSACDTVKLYTIEVRALHTVGQHTKEIARSAGRL